ncbi:MAG: capsular biosynthesis protein, partial [Pedobacter sp.]
MEKTNNKKKQEQEENVIQQMLAKYLPYWPLLFIAVAIGLAAAYIYTKYKVPLYQATATIIIKDEKKGTDESKLMESLNTVSSKQLVENEIEVIQSRALMDSVVRQQHLYASIEEEGKLRKSSAYLKSPIQIESANPDSITEVTDKSISYDAATGTVEIDNSLKFKINKFVQTPYGKLKFVPNKLYKPAYATMNPLKFSLLYPENVTSVLLQSLEVTSASKMSTIIE